MVGSKGLGFNLVQLGDGLMDHTLGFVFGLQVAQFAHTLAQGRLGFQPLIDGAQTWPSHTAHARQNNTEKEPKQRTNTKHYLATPRMARNDGGKATHKRNSRLERLIALFSHATATEVSLGEGYCSRGRKELKGVRVTCRTTERVCRSFVKKSWERESRGFGREEKQEW